MSESKRQERILREALMEQREAIREALTKGQVDQWIHSEVERYLTTVRRSNASEERKMDAARAKISGPQDLLTVREVAALLKVHPITVRKYVRLGVLQGRKVISRILIPRSSVMKLVEAMPIQSKGGDK